MVGLPLVEGDVMDEMLTFKEAMEFLKVSEKVLTKLLQEEDVPARKLGKEWRFSRQKLIEWIGEGRSSYYAKNAKDTNNEVD